MPRQTFATREFFVDTCESTTREAVFALSQIYSRIRFVSDNLKLHCLQFLYEPEGEQRPVLLAISLLPVNESHTKITVHGSYPDRCAFNKDRYITTAVANVEAALQVAISGAATSYEPPVPKKNLTQRCHDMKQATAGFLQNAMKGRRRFKPLHS